MMHSILRHRVVFGVLLCSLAISEATFAERAYRVVKDAFPVRVMNSDGVLEFVFSVKPGTVISYDSSDKLAPGQLYTLGRRRLESRKSWYKGGQISGLEDLLKNGAIDQQTFEKLKSMQGKLVFHQKIKSKSRWSAKPAAPKTLVSAPSRPRSTSNLPPVRNPRRVPSKASEAPAATPSQTKDLAAATEAPASVPTATYIGLPKGNSFIRKSPGTRNRNGSRKGRSDVIGKAKRSDRLEILGEEEDRDGDTWYKVKVPGDPSGKVGYIYSGQMREVKEKPTALASGTGETVNEGKAATSAAKSDPAGTKKNSMPTSAQTVDNSEPEPMKPAKALTAKEKKRLAKVRKYMASSRNFRGCSAEGKKPFVPFGAKESSIGKTIKDFWQGRNNFSEKPEMVDPLKTKWGKSLYSCEHRRARKLKRYNPDFRCGFGRGRSCSYQNYTVSSGYFGFQGDSPEEKLKKIYRGGNIIIHQVATGSKRYNISPSSPFNFAKKKRRQPDVQYNYVIDPCKCQIVSGRPLQYMGSGNQGSGHTNRTCSGSKFPRNVFTRDPDFGNITIAVHGQFSGSKGNELSQCGARLLKHLVTWLQTNYKMNNVYGHQHIRGYDKDCPGHNVKKHLAHLFPKTYRPEGVRDRKTAGEKYCMIRGRKVWLTKGCNPRLCHKGKMLDNFYCGSKKRGTASIASGYTDQIDRAIATLKGRSTDGAKGVK